jgi:molecular chaperone DnaK (HSP70)
MINRLTIEARHIKENLSTSERCEISLKDFMKFDGKSYTLNFTITRADFDELAFPLYERIFERLENFINENFNNDEIGKIILAGGTCQIPYIHQRISAEFGNLQETADSLRLVVNGALRVAQMKNAEENLNLESVLPHSLGVAMMTNERKLIFDKLLDKGTPYPCEIIREYETAFDNQTRIDVNIYEAGNESETDLKFHRFRGTLTLKNIPPAPKGKTFIDVKFEYTEDQSLRVTAIDKQRANHFERQIIEKQGSRVVL